MKLHSISAGDVVRAFRILDARDEETRAAIARLLGFDLQAEARAMGRPTRHDEKPSLEIHPLSIGGKADPVRLVFNTRAGPALNASVIDLGNRFRMILNTVDVIAAPEPLPKLPVARAVWIPQPNLKIAAAAWIYAGGAHHTGFSQSLTAAYLQQFAEMANVECVLIDEHTTVADFKKELRWNEAAY